MKLKFLALATSLLVASPAFSADWTPVLKEMQNSCKIENIGQIINKQKAMPKNLKGDIISHKTDGFGNGVITLKNATAFGYPISKIDFQLPQGGEAGLKLYFKSVDFKKVLPQFYYKVGNKTVKGDIKTAIGYKYNENGGITKITEIPYPKRIPSKWDKNQYVYDLRKYGFSNGDDYSPNAVFDEVAIGETTGWDIVGSGESMSGVLLTSDSKQKMLYCVHWSE